MLVSVIVPVYNEATRIREALAEILRAVSLRENDWEVLVIDDGSTDGTTEALISYPDHRALRRFYLPENRGKAAAVQHGIRRARGQFIVIQDADQEYDSKELLHVVSPLLHSRADVSFGSRYLAGPPYRTVHPLWHWAVNKLITTVFNLVHGTTLTDVETCYKAFRAEILKNALLTSKRFGLEIELATLATRHRTVEIPITYRPRSKAEGKKIGWRDGLQALWDILKYRVLPPGQLRDPANG